MIHYTSPVDSAEMIFPAADISDSDLTNGASRILAFSQSLIVGDSKL